MAGMPSVSIHAPAWGATFPGTLPALACQRFNPRARVGRDKNMIAAHPVTASFNPRARVGRDMASMKSMA